MPQTANMAVLLRSAAPRAGQRTTAAVAAAIVTAISGPVRTDEEYAEGAKPRRERGAGQWIARGPSAPMISLFSPLSPFFLLRSLRALCDLSASSLRPLRTPTPSPPSAPHPARTHAGRPGTRQ